MVGRHPERDLVPFLRGELAAADRERVDRHLVACARCRAAAEGYRRLLDDLARSAPLAPAVHWRRYRAEVRERIERRTRRPAVAFEEIMQGRRLGLLERYEVLERLDLFEDLDVIQHLDGLSTASES